MDFETLHRWAEEEVRGVMSALPEDVREAAAGVPISFEERPGAGALDDELQGDELGLFEGVCLLDEPGPEDLPRIRIFLRNLWEWVEQDEQDFLDEVGTTFLHELGHYLGWDEEDVGLRGLE
jgi:predicted Zn-dependent protease with MMP-like domain